MLLLNINLNPLQQEISVSETPSLVTLVDSSLAPSAGGTGDNHICVGKRYAWPIPLYYIKRYECQCPDKMLFEHIHLFHEEDTLNERY